jgi:hypothetical protein
MGKVLDISGQTFGRLTVVSFIGLKNRKAVWSCLCACGNSKETLAASLKNGIAQSCGCLKSEMIIARNKGSATHRMKEHQLYPTWVMMRSRCNRPKDTQYHNYGARGIRVCAEWDDFSVFVDQMGNRPERTTLDRINPNAGYSRENCRWATAAEQSRNTRINRVVAFEGESRCITEWSEITGIEKTVLASRLNRGWSVEQALTESVVGKHRKRRA